MTYKVKNLEIPNDIRSLEAEINAFFEESDLEVVGVLHSDQRYNERKGRTMLRITLLLREKPPEPKVIAYPLKGDVVLHAGDTVHLKTGDVKVSVV